MLSVPVEIVAPPVNWLMPVRNNVPAPDNVKPCVPNNTELMVSFSPEFATVIVGVVPPPNVIVALVAIV